MSRGRLLIWTRRAWDSWSRWQYRSSANSRISELRLVCACAVTSGYEQSFLWIELYFINFFFIIFIRISYFSQQFQWRIAKLFLAWSRPIRSRKASHFWLCRARLGHTWQVLLAYCRLQTRKNVQICSLCLYKVLSQTSKQADNQTSNCKQDLW